MLIETLRLIFCPAIVEKSGDRWELVNLINFIFFKRVNKFKYYDFLENT